MLWRNPTHEGDRLHAFAAQLSKKFNTLEADFMHLSAMNVIILGQVEVAESALLSMLT